MERPIKWKIEDIIDSTSNDEDQSRILKILADYRGFDLKTIINAGIMYIPDLGELDYFGEEKGYKGEELGINEEIEFLYEEGYLIPIRDVENEIIFYINYSFERDKSKKYIMVHPNIYERDKEVRLSGLHNYKKALEKDTIVLVEGYFDQLRLEAEGIAAFAILGTKLTEFQKMFISPFKRAIYIKDNDTSGEYAFKKYQKELDNIVSFDILPSYEDVDNLGKNGGYEYHEWIEKLKRYIG